jgi:periplasmic protein TonB
MKMQLLPLHGAAQRTGMMGQETISAPELQAGRSREAPTASRRRRFLLTAVVLSVAAHLAAALLIVLLPRVVPQEARPQEEGTVELLMVEKKGAEPSQAGQPDEHEPTLVPPEKKTETPRQEAPRTETPALASDANPAPRVPENGDEPVPPTSAQAPSHPDKAVPAQMASRPAPPTPEAPVFDLEGTESDSNAVALGARILPAMPDNKFRNRPPAFPVEAEMRGQHGTVVVVIHVSENGIATGAEVTQSSGVEALDQAAIAAVRKWRFHPAMQAGRTIPFDMPFRFVFEAY